MSKKETATKKLSDVQKKMKELKVEVWDHLKEAQEINKKIQPLSLQLKEIQTKMDNKNIEIARLEKEAEELSEKKDSHLEAVAD